MSITYNEQAEEYTPIPEGFRQVMAHTDDTAFHALFADEYWNGFAVVYILPDDARAVLGDEADAVTPAAHGLVSLSGFCVTVG